MANLSAAVFLRDGYDLPVYGLDNGLFYGLHIPAVSCILTSLCCAIVAIAVSFRRRNYRSFFNWTKCDRFVVYLALCDGCFNLVHICDHLQMMFTKNHVYPKELCQVYGFFIIVFISAQNLMVNIVAINVFTLIYFNRQLHFGQWDWKLVLWTFGVPVSGAVIAAVLGQFGTTGAFCFFDGVNGVIGNLCFTTIPLLIILSTNIVFYALTWTKLRRETKRLADNLGQNTSSRNAAIKAAQSMSLFVVAFFVQWSSGGVFAAWALFDTVPIVLFHLITIFNNIGGVLNLIVYVIVRRKKLVSQTPRKSSGSSPKRIDDMTESTNAIATVLPVS